jgi:hypothetical protein
VDTQYTYDAAGRAINVVGQGGDLTQTQVFDGDGVRTVLSSQQVTHNGNGTTSTESKTQYFVTSSVLGGVVTELNESGAKTRTFVYQGSQILAWQQQNGTTQTMAWEHRDVSNASVRGGTAAELDPLGMNAGVINPFPYHSTRPALQEARTYPGFADMMSGSQCHVDGIDYPCSMINGEATLQCPDNDCGPHAIRVTNPDGETRSILTTPFMAFANGVSGFFWPGWAEMGTPQMQADAWLAVSRGANPTGMDSSHRQGQGQFANNFLPQEPGPTGDCARFADLVEGIANETLDSKGIQTFMDRLATTFTEFRAARFGAVVFGGTALEPANTGAHRFGSSGFASSYFEPDWVDPDGTHHPSNQVRHAVGGLIAGYVGIGLGRMNSREDPNDRDHGVPDINLNGQTVPMGARIADKNLGTMFGPKRKGPFNVEAAKGLANWIRNTLCAH